MDVVTYALFSYGLTAIISLMVIGIIVVISKFLNRNNGEQELQ